MKLEFFKLLWTLLGCVALLLTIPGTIELIFLTVGGIMPRRKLVEKVDENFRLAVVVPAHNEASNIETCLQNLIKFADEKTAIIVIADNCTDETASVAEKTGARVLVRNNPAERGKGYALDFAFNELLPENFDAYLVIDADTIVAPNLFDESRRAFISGADAIQCRYTVANADSSVRTRLMNVALLAFNVLRPRGRAFFGISCGILGNGFGLRAETLHAVPYKARSVVEDLEYHLDLIRKDFKVSFIDAASVYGEMPASGKGVKTQRSRWEGGRLRMIWEFAPKLFSEVLRGRFRLIEPLLELLLLPLAFHVALLFVALAQFSFALQSAALLSLAVAALHILAAIAVGGGGLKDLAALFAAPFYILWKLTLLKSLVKSARSDNEWVRTARVNPGKNYD